MVDGKLLHRIVVWPTYEDAIAAEADAASEDCKRDNRLTVWDTYQQAAAHTSVASGYVARAVHFDGTQKLVNNSLVAPVGGFFAFSVWVKSEWDDYRPVFVVDP